MQFDQKAALMIWIAWNNDLEPEGSAETTSSDLVSCMHSAVVV
jgi:hypothetical protein